MLNNYSRDLWIRKRCIIIPLKVQDKSKLNRQKYVHLNNYF